MMDWTEAKIILLWSSCKYNSMQSAKGWENDVCKNISMDTAIQVLFGCSANGIMSPLHQHINMLNIFPWMETR